MPLRNWTALWVSVERRSRQSWVITKGANQVYRFSPEMGKNRRFSACYPPQKTYLYHHRAILENLNRRSENSPGSLRQARNPRKEKHAFDKAK